MSAALLFSRSRAFVRRLLGWGAQRKARQVAPQVDATVADTLSALRARQVELEKDLFYLEDEDLAACTDKRRRALLLKARAELLGELVGVGNALLKATRGEGSRGGHVVGHTRSGKPIYAHSEMVDFGKSTSPLASAGVFPSQAPDVHGERTTPRYSGLVHHTIGRAPLLFKSRRLHGRRLLDGLRISIENRRGSVRRWYDPHVERHGQTRMRDPYGYIRGTLGTDGDQVDCFLGPLARTGQIEQTTVYVVRTRKPPDFREPDENKLMLGFPSLAAARAAFLAHYDDPRFIGQIDALAWDEFKAEVRATAHGGGFVRGEVVERAPIAKGRALVFGRAAGQARASAAPREQATASRTSRPLVFGRPMRSGGPPPPGQTAPGPGETSQTTHDVPPEQVAQHLATVRPRVAEAVTQFTALFSGVPVAGRLKETAGLATVGQKGTPPDDLASVRVTVQSTAEERLALRRIQRSLSVTTVRDFLERPQAGYRGIDLMVTIQGAPLEVQLRTPRQTAWADYAHDAAYQMRGAEGGAPEVVTYLRTMSDYFAQRDEGGSGAAPACPPAVQTRCGALAEPAGPPRGTSPSDAERGFVPPSGARAESAGDTDRPVVDILAVRDLDTGAGLEVRALSGEEAAQIEDVMATARRRYPAPRYEVWLGVAADLATFVAAYPRFRSGRSGRSTTQRGEQHGHSSDGAREGSPVRAPTTEHGDGEDGGAGRRSVR